ncbi:MAG: sialidase [Thermoanaerobaculia bacterium]
MLESRYARVFLLAPALVCIGITATVGTAIAAEVPSASSTDSRDNLFDGLEYRFIGPVGNRVPAVAGVPGDPAVYYAGAASGGIFKTTDGGAHWQPVFDDHPVSSIGSLAVAPSDFNIVWAGTGETFLRANISIGDGIYRSTDAGENWQRMGLEKTGRIGRVIVHPQDPNIVYAAALGSVYEPQQERGVYRTLDGGETWERILFVDENTGASDLVMDPNNPRILFAGMWEISINTWSRKSGGPGSSLWVTRDGGETWKKLEEEGLPKPPWGKIGLTMSADDSSRVYALIETSSNRDFSPIEEFQGVVWRSDDGGEEWSMVSADNDLVQRPLYYSRALAAPDDRDEIYFMSVRHRTSLDGAKTSFLTKNQPGWDHHDMWIDPENADRMIVGHDGGVSISINRGRSWLKPQLPIAQMYHVAVDQRVPYFVYGNRQDGPTTRGPSNNLIGEKGIPIGDWRPVGGCETGFAVPDPVETNIVWSGCYDGILERHDLETGHGRDVSVWPESIESWPAKDIRYRFQWTFPLVISPHDHNRVYVGSQFVHQTTDGGDSWSLISPDLTTDDPELQQRTGGLTLDDASPTLAPTIFALAESQLEEGLIWAGTNDGQVQVTRDGGENWTNVTTNLPNLPSRGTVSNIEPSRHSAGTAYLTVDRHQLGDSEPYVYKTTDYGLTWKAISSDLPRSVLSYAHSVREDPVRPGLLFLGTESGVWVSFDDGTHWRSLQSNLPHAPVHWLEIQDHFDDLVVATYGRGFWILDDLTPLRELEPGSLPENPHLFEPRQAYRFRLLDDPFMQPEDPAAGTNPEYGASLHYYLAEEPEEKVGLEILDAAGEVVYAFDKVKKEAGLHRAHWNLRYEKTPEVKLRTKPVEDPHLRMPDKNWRPLSDGRQFSLLAPPGTYSVRLTVGDQIQTRDLVVVQDPNSKATASDLRSQMEVLFDLRQMQTEAARIINEIEWLRRQIYELQARLKDTDLEGAEELITAGTELDDKLKELEGEFFDLRLTGARQDHLRWLRLLYGRIAYLTRAIAGSDFAPTSQQREVYELLKTSLAEQQQRLSELKKTELASFDQLLDDNGVPHLVTGLKSEKGAPTE